MKIQNRRTKLKRNNTYTKGQKEKKYKLSIKLKTIKQNKFVLKVEIENKIFIKGSTKKTRNKKNKDQIEKQNILQIRIG